LNVIALIFNMFRASHYLSVDYLERLIIYDFMKGFIHLVTGHLNDYSI